MEKVFNLNQFQVKIFHAPLIEELIRFKEMHIMSKKLKKILWSQKNLSSSIQNYFDANMGEFNTGCVESNYPYSGKYRKNLGELHKLRNMKKILDLKEKDLGVGLC